jgi:predicted amidohydrolase
MEEEQPQRNIKSLICQIKPIHKDKPATLKRIEISLEKYNSQDKLDIIVFP